MVVKICEDLESMSDILFKLEKAGTKDIKGHQLYQDLRHYRMLRYFFMTSPEKINKSDYYDVTKKVHKLKVASETYTEYSELLFNEYIIKAYTDLLTCIRANPNLQYGRYKSEDIINTIRLSSILPITLLDKDFFETAKAKSENRYIGICPYHKGENNDFIVNSKMNKFICLDNECNKDGNSATLLSDLYDIKFLSSIETLSKWVQYSLTIDHDKQINIRYDIIDRLNEVINNKKYIDLVNESYNLTIYKYPNMSSDKIIKTYKFTH